MRTLTRDQAIGDLRQALLKLVDDEHSECQVAARLGILCRGFRQFTDEELRKRYQWILKKRPWLNREELEDFANRWQLARQLVQNTKLSCDTQTIEHDTCRGWDEYTDDQLVEFHRTICGEEIAIAPEAGLPHSA